MPRHHTQHVLNVGPNLFVHNENSAYVMPYVTAHAVMSCTHHMAHACRQASPYVYVAWQKLHGHSICTSQTIFIKINHLTVYHLKYKNCKPECAEMDSHCHAQQEQGQLQ